MKILPTVLSVLCALTIATAGDKDTVDTQAVPELDRMVITATRTQRRLADVPVSVSVIERADIESAPARNIEDLLMSEPGVSVKRVVGMGEGIPGDVIIRGVPGAYAASRLLVLVDGIPTNVSGTPFLILNQIPLASVGRVELVRGPFSCLYGSNAFSGALNIITRQAVDRPFTAMLYHDFFPGLYADVGFWSSGAPGNASYMLSGSLRGITSLFAGDSALVVGPNGTINVSPEGYSYREERIIGRLSYWLNEKARLSLHGRYFHSDLSFGYSQDELGAPVTNYGTTFLGGADLHTQLSDAVDFKLSGYGRKLVADYYSSKRLDDGSVVATNWKDPYTYDGMLTTQATLRLGRFNTLVCGADYLYNSVVFGQTMNTQSGEVLYEGAAALIQNAGFYAQNELIIEDALSAQAGVRLDYHSEAGAVVSPKLAASYRPFDRLRGRMSFGRAFRAPNMVELYMPEQPLISGFVVMKPSPELQPEYLYALEGGIEATHGPLSLTLNGFSNWMEDLISPALVQDDPSDPLSLAIYHRNISEAWSGGWEVLGAAHWNTRLQLSLSYTYTDSWDRSIGQPLEYVAAHSANAVLSWRIPLRAFSVSGSITEIAVGRRVFMQWQAHSIGQLRFGPNGTYLPVQEELPAYWRTDASIRLDYRDRAFVSLTGTNLTGRDYQESAGVRTPGRMLAIKTGVAW